MKKYKHKNTGESHAVVYGHNMKRYDIPPGKEFIIEGKIVNGGGIQFIEEIIEEEQPKTVKKVKKIKRSDKE